MADESNLGSMSIFNEESLVALDLGKKDKVFMRIIFHHPLPLNVKSNSASGIRPLRMLKAFQELGYEVDLVTGYGRERKKAIRQIKSNIRQGVKYDFVYAESSTMPTTMTEKHHIPIFPLLDFLFFSFCKKANIPVGLFYRDIFWIFSTYASQVSPVKAYLAKLGYKFDLWVYKKTLTKLFLPSLKMGDYVPYVDPSLFAELPPGHLDRNDHLKKHKKGSPLKLFYVGGVGWGYQMHKLFRVLVSMPQIQFTLCTREDEWEAVKDQYPEPTENIHIIHKTGLEMEEHLKNSDIAVVFVKPQEYWSFAAPVKLFEYIGSYKPILSSKMTLAGEFVEENGIGWSISYDENALIEFLEYITSNPIEIEKVKEKLIQIAPSHTWRSRALTVQKSLL